MTLPIHETLAIVREQPDPALAWSAIVDLCRAAHAASPWNSLPTLDFQRDIVAATEWLRLQIQADSKANGLYLGLDTLNMGEGDGNNVEFGASQDCDTTQDSSDWLWDAKLTYGEGHLIYGLYELHRVYQTPAWTDAFSLCDYIFFLGYSGIVLSSAFECLHTDRTLLPAWGFHDGDMFTLGRKDAGRFTRICK